jgi:hypothetical protein
MSFILCLLRLCVEILGGDYLVDYEPDGSRAARVWRNGLFGTYASMCFMRYSKPHKMGRTAATHCEWRFEVSHYDPTFGSALSTTALLCTSVFSHVSSTNCFSLASTPSRLLTCGIALGQSPRKASITVCSDETGIS